MTLPIRTITTRFCLDCQHRTGFRWLVPQCQSPHLGVDPVTGHAASSDCDVQRSRVNEDPDAPAQYCGPEGRYWVERSR